METCLSQTIKLMSTDVFFDLANTCSYNNAYKTVSLLTFILERKRHMIYQLGVSYDIIYNNVIAKPEVAAGRPWGSGCGWGLRPGLGVREGPWLWK